ncbi:MAG TPA: alcohol dehydrogenase catalytic domain-containing protein, partial [Trebonia sp.]|nr:alcohol dehydrogenase catalytic domain-containing protein [Trebonia sp.]
MHSLQEGQAADGQIRGHEFSGRVVALGRDVTGWRAGQPVAASPLGSCGKCRICARGLAAGMPPSEVADKLVNAIRGDGLYQLTDHEWDPQIV